MEDEKIIRLLFERNEDALSEITQKYGRFCSGVVRGILKDESDIEECANDILLSAWNSIPPNCPERLSTYLCTLAKRTAIDKLRHNTRLKRNQDYIVLLSELEECISDKEPMAPEDDSKDIRETLNRFLSELDKETRIIFLKRYVYSESVAAISEKLGIKENTISAKLMRTRKRLKQYLKNEGIGL